MPTPGLIELWAEEASPEVTRVLVQADEVHAGWINVRVAAVDGAASPAAIDAASIFINTRLNAGSGGLERASVSGVDVLQVQVLSVITVEADLLAAVQADANARWLSYLSSIPIGGRILFSELVRAIIDAGLAAGSTLIDLDGGATAINTTPLYAGFVQLGPVQVAQAADQGLYSPSVTWLVPA